MIVIVMLFDVLAKQFLYQFLDKEKLESFMELEDLEKALEREAEHYKSKFLSEIQAHGVIDPTIWRFALKFT